MRYLVDTCVISEIVKPQPAAQVTTWLDMQEELALFLSVITFGEMQKGISKLPDSQKRRTLQAWMTHDLPRRFMGRILGMDLEVAIRWGTIVGEAEQRGQPIPVLDGLLAATALVSGLTFVTRNTRHLQPTGVPLLNPWEA